MLSKIRALAFATALVASTGLQAVAEDVLLTIDGPTEAGERDRKSTRLNSSHPV